MKRICLYLVAIVLTVACSKGDDEKIVTSQMTMSSQHANVTFSVMGLGEMSIDWGDNTEIENCYLPSEKELKVYSFAIPIN